MGGRWPEPPPTTASSSASQAGAPNPPVPSAANYAATLRLVAELQEELTQRELVARQAQERVAELEVQTALAQQASLRGKP